MRGEGFGLGRQRTFHYAWLIFIGCCCVNTVGMAASISVVGVYLLPVSGAIGVGPGDWMLWMTVDAITSCLVTSLWGRWIQTKNINVVTTLSAVVLAGSIFMFSFGNSVQWFWIWGGILGLGLPCIATLTVPSLLGNWFAGRYRGRMLGIASAFTGVGVFVWAPVFTLILQNFGWEVAYRVNAAVVLIMTLPWTLFVFKYKPADKGLEPFGQDPIQMKAEGALLQAGMSSGKARRSLPFWIMIMVILLTSVGMGFNSNQVAIATEVLSSVMEAERIALLGAAMISAAALGNICGKVSFGFLQGKFGLRKTFIGFVTVFFCGFALWTFVPSPTALLIGAFLFGSHNALISVGYPLLVRELFGNRDYPKIYANLMTVNGFMGGFSGTIISFVYQTFGSYRAALIAALCLVVCIGVLVVWACRYVNKMKWDYVVETEAAA